ncbi:MAG: trypsin-like peptidase domain-containing protein [Dokdonella sp.]|uniref:trypsin-like peptidase domain-containing protein n=1 Tax=Dokdonella sp. TaxID=2291710 RepID=UPI0025C55567|nr:trypsin-like peptidase domain-containing protein [Dokdonella sp.]MBZ0222557.1 trypsin-like peptidase domain-containing protein [Dokdonella sp.]MCC7256145.1 trypsin-like peptidase domain-containing protein [Dokdonella sp.]
MNTSYAFVALVIAFGLAAFPAGAGGIYKWKDAQGNLHFSDTPPPDVKTKAGVDKVEVKGGYGNFNVSSKSPIRNPRPGSASLVSLSRFTLRPGSDGRAFTAGRAYSGRNCENSTDLIWDEGTVDVKGKALQNAVAERFRDAGYGLSVSEGGDLLPGSLDLEADLTDIKIDVCNTRMAGNSAGTGSRVYVKMRWKLAAKGSDLYKGSSEGAYDGWHNGSSVRDSLLRAVKQASDNLLGDAEFAAQLGAGSSFAVASAGTASQVAIKYGDGGEKFRAHSDERLQSAVTVRTDRGHGSGVVIDAAGYALTNAHVVGDDVDVQVILGDKALMARVVKRDRRNDVALLHFSADPLQAAPIARGVPKTGDPLYVIGTPLSLKLSHSVTEGILSAVREEDGARFYQTDAAINPGNSGGPVFNEAGELVAITVAGLFNKEGSSLNVNYLIPIDRALGAVGVAH